MTAVEPQAGRLLPQTVFVDPDWLALRESADTAARDAHGGELLALLAAQWPATDRVVVDVGAGTGANRRWLAGRLPTPPERQRWVAVDHDARIHDWAGAHGLAVEADLADVGSTFPDVASREGALSLVTGSALLDVLPAATADALVDATVASGAPALFALSVTGDVALDPPDPDDALVAGAFDAHQRRGGRLGPDAPEHVARRFSEHGWNVHRVQSPWILGPQTPELLREWLLGRAAPAVEQQPEQGAVIDAWLARRLALAEAGQLRGVVDHVDLLALPPNSQQPATEAPAAQLRRGPRRGGRPRRNSAPLPAVVAWLPTMLAVVLVWAILVAPDQATANTWATWLRLPLEGIVAGVLLTALPLRGARLAAAVVAFALVVLTAMKLLDWGYYAALDRPFDVVADRTSLRQSVDLIADTTNTPTAIAVVVGIVIAGFGLCWVLWRALNQVAGTRLAGGTAPRRRRSLLILSASGLAWLCLAAAGVPRGEERKVAALDLPHYVAERLATARTSLALAGTTPGYDRFAGVSSGRLLDRLRGKDVVVVFVESFGRTALDDPELNSTVGPVLAEHDGRLRAAGFASRSGWLTSPTFGGMSWLAHATLLSGWTVGTQPAYDALLQTDRLTLTRAFADAGWRTVAVMPGTRQEWPAAAFYGYDKVYAAGELGYRGPTFGWATMPDQFALDAFRRRELPVGHAPVMATVELISSHAPWTSIPDLVPWEAVTDPATYAPKQGGRHATGSTVPGKGRAEPGGVRADYAAATAYSLEAAWSFVERFVPPDDVVILLGDHQPAAVVVGSGATRDVPVAIATGDAAVLAELDDWGWSTGLRPGPDAARWPMADVRDRFLAAFTTNPP